MAKIEVQFSEHDIKVIQEALAIAIDVELHKGKWELQGHSSQGHPVFGYTKSKKVIHLESTQRYLSNQVTPVKGNFDGNITQLSTLAMGSAR
jgi:hypothetical protein